MKTSKEQSQERVNSATNLERVTRFMDYGSPMNQLFVIESINRYAKQIIKNPKTVRKGMKNSPINSNAWIAAAAEWLRQNPEYK